MSVVVLFQIRWKGRDPYPYQYHSGEQQAQAACSEKMVIPSVRQVTTAKWLPQSLVYGKYPNSPTCCRTMEKNLTTTLARAKLFDNIIRAKDCLIHLIVSNSDAKNFPKNKLPHSASNRSGNTDDTTRPLSNLLVRKS